MIVGNPRRFVFNPLTTNTVCWQASPLCLKYPSNWPRTFSFCHAGLSSTLVAFFNVTFFSLAKTSWETAVISAPVSSLIIWLFRIGFAIHDTFWFAVNTSRSDALIQVSEEILCWLAASLVWHCDWSALFWHLWHVISLAGHLSCPCGPFPQRPCTCFSWTWFGKLTALLPLRFHSVQVSWLSNVFYGLVFVYCFSSACYFHSLFKVSLAFIWSLSDNALSCMPLQYCLWSFDLYLNSP